MVDLQVVSVGLAVGRWPCSVCNRGGSKDDPQRPYTVVSFAEGGWSRGRQFVCCHECRKVLRMVLDIGSDGR